VFGPERYSNLAGALPVAPGGAVVDLGCGDGMTLAALADCVEDTSMLVGVDAEPGAFAGARCRRVVADLNEPLSFAEGTFDAAVCQNVIECLRDPQQFLVDVERILAPGGHLLLGHSDFDTLVFSTSDVPLTRRLVHHFCDTVQPWMTVADGTMGRRLLSLAHRSPLELVRTHAWVGHHTTFEPGGPAHTAAMLIADSACGDAELAGLVHGWMEDLERQAAAGEFFYSINDYAVLLRKAVG
jgi:SAM-dependent methyltransferase